LDTQSRCLCLPSGRRFESNTNTDGVAYSDRHAYSNRYIDNYS
jgi:hypothetical protein